MIMNVERIRPAFKSSKTISISPLGEWEIDDDAHVTFVSEKLGFVRFRIPANIGGRMFTIFHPVELDYAIGVADEGNIVWRFRATDGSMEDVAVLVDRDATTDSGIQFIKAIANNHGLFLIYETGLLFFDRDGQLVWRRDHLKLDWQFQGLDDTGIVFENSQGRHRKFSTADGSEAML